MFTNNFNRAWRSIVRNRMFAFVNIAGLALAVAACLLIGLIIHYEWNYDRQSPHATNTWRAFNETITDGKTVTQDANTHSSLGPSLEADLPEVVSFTRLYNRGYDEVNILRGDIPYKISNPFMVDTGFLKMFPQQFISGDAVTPLKEPYSIILTKSTAEKLFGNSDPVGEILEAPGGWMGGRYTVTAVVADPPQNTHLKFGLLASYQTRYAQGHTDNWSSYWDYTYFQLSPGADPGKIKKQLAIYSDKHLKQEGISFNMQKLTDIHLHSKLTYEIEPNGDARTIKALAFIVLFILGIAFVNYINLTTAQSFIRSKEVAVRKVLGANRIQLIKQFLFEGGLMSAFAILLAVMLLWISLPRIESYLGKSLMNYPGFNQNLWWMLPGIWLICVVGACLYPAIALSSFAPLVTLRGRLGLTGKQNLRKVLVVFQFACSTILIIGIFVIIQQLNFLRNHDKGLSVDKIIALKIPEFDWRQDSLNQQKMGVLRQEISQISGVSSVATSGIVPTQGIATIAGTSGGMFWTQNPAAVTPSTIYFYNAEPAFFSTYSIRFIAGAPFEAASVRESNQHIVINESAVDLFGFPDAQTAIGKQVAYHANPESKMTIHGVVTDFHIESSKEPVRPTLYFCSPALTNGYISVKADNANIENLVKNIQKVWKASFPEYQFQYIFLDDAFDRQYKNEEQLALFISAFTAFAIFIACLGLFGLAFITTGQRTKEIGIRKVLGASVANIVTLLSKDYLKLVLVSIIIAIPVAGWLINLWLQNFAYRIDPPWWVFILAGLLAILIALITVSFQSIKTARSNPVKNLRTE